MPYSELLKHLIAVIFSKKLYENLRCKEEHVRTMDGCEEPMKCFNSIFIKKLIEINSISLGG